MRANPELLETTIGHRFEDREVLQRALTHSSHVHEQALSGQEGALRDNEQLEFLGDAVLGFLISESLVRLYPEYPEGTLSKIKARLVSAAYLFDVAQKLELGNYLELGRGEELSGGRGKRKMLVDSLEALMAAIYLDGGMDAARRFVDRFILRGAAKELLSVPERVPAAMVDFKSALQELAQSHRLPQPRYSIVRERGPEHSKTFTIEVRVGKEWIAQADGYTKKGAAQNAAREVYQRLLESVRPDVEILRSTPEL